MLTFSQKLADLSGEILRHYWHTPLTREKKADASPVTQADREAEQAMRTLIGKTFPEHGIIGEEYGNTNPEAQYQWVLDPIDGTRAFIAGIPTFTTLIALTRNKVPILGIINQPVTNERWTGLSGAKTLYNGNPTQVRTTKDLISAAMATTSMDYFNETEKAAFMRLKARTSSCRLGGDAYSYAILADGQMDVVIDAGMKLYDYMALVPVVEGAGGVITDWDNKPLTLHSKGQVLAAATKELHAEALQSLHIK